MQREYHALPAPGPQREFEHAMREWDEVTRAFLLAPICLEAVDAYLAGLKARNAAYDTYMNGGTA